MKDFQMAVYLVVMMDRQMVVTMDVLLELL